MSKINLSSPILNRSEIARQLGMSTVMFHRKITGAPKTRPFTPDQLTQIQEIIKKELYGKV